MIFQQVDLNASDSTSNVHGNIRCRNILVFYHDREEIGIRLGDPGLVHYYKTLPVTDDANIER